MKFYKVLMTAAALLAACMMAWCGVAATVSGCALAVCSVRNHTGLLLMVVLVLSGVVAALLSRRIPSPLPQLLLSVVLGVLHTAFAVWAEHPSPAEVPLNSLLWDVFQTAAMALPTVSAAAALFSLPAAFARDVGRRSHALLSFFALLALIVTADAAMTLLDRYVLPWERLVRHVPGFTESLAADWIRPVLRFCTGIPVRLRLAGGALLLLLLGGGLYAAGKNKLRRSRDGLAYLPQPRRSAPPVRRRTGSMNAQDAALLEAMAAQTVSGTPIGLNTATGAPNVAGVRH